MSDEQVITALNLFRKAGYASASLLERKMHIDYKQASQIVGELERRGHVSAARPNNVNMRYLLPPEH